MNYERKRRGRAILVQRVLERSSGRKTCEKFNVRNNQKYCAICFYLCPARNEQRNVTRALWRMC